MPHTLHEVGPHSNRTAHRCSPSCDLCEWSTLLCPDLIYTNIYMRMPCESKLALGVWQSNGSCMGFVYKSDEVVRKSAEFKQVLIPTRPFWNFQKSCSFRAVWGSSGVLIGRTSRQIRIWFACLGPANPVRPPCNILQNPTRVPIQPVKMPCDYTPILPNGELCAHCI